MHELNKTTEFKLGELLEKLIYNKPCICSAIKILELSFFIYIVKNTF